jgi:hypothetical protein
VPIFLGRRVFSSRRPLFTTPCFFNLCATVTSRAIIASIVALSPPHLYRPTFPPSATARPHRGQKYRTIPVRRRVRRRGDRGEQPVREMRDQAQLAWGPVPLGDGGAVPQIVQRRRLAHGRDVGSDRARGRGRWAGGGEQGQGENQACAGSIAGKERQKIPILHGLGTMGKTQLAVGLHGDTTTASAWCSG